MITHETVALLFLSNLSVTAAHSETCGADRGRGLRGGCGMRQSTRPLQKYDANLQSCVIIISNMDGDLLSFQLSLGFFPIFPLLPGDSGADFQKPASVNVSVFGVQTFIVDNISIHQEGRFSSIQQYSNEQVNIV